jgi:hypothetical protein
MRSRCGEHAPVRVWRASDGISSRGSVSETQSAICVSESSARRRQRELAALLGEEMGLDPADAADAAELEGIVRQLRGIGVSNKTVPPKHPEFLKI